jgi:hypothetical protein
MKTEILNLLEKPIVSKIAIFALLISTLIFISCSDPEGDYKNVQKLLAASENILENSYDYDILIKTCDDAINILEKYLEAHKEGNWSEVAKNSLLSWKSRKISFEQELNYLLEQLHDQLKTRAEKEAKKKHPISKIESINLDDRIKTKVGNSIQVMDTYSIRMVGAILGKNIFKLSINVSGSLAMDTQTITVDEKVIIDE